MPCRWRTTSGACLTSVAVNARPRSTPKRGPVSNSIDGRGEIQVRCAMRSCSPTLLEDLSLPGCRGCLDGVPWASQWRGVRQVQGGDVVDGGAIGDGGGVDVDAFGDLRAPDSAPAPWAATRSCAWTPPWSPRKPRPPPPPTASRRHPRTLTPRSADPPFPCEIQEFSQPSVLWGVQAASAVRGTSEKNNQRGTSLVASSVASH